MRGEGMTQLVEVAAGGGGWLVGYTGFPEVVWDEVDDALLGLEGSGDAGERVCLVENGVLSWRIGCNCEGRDPSPVIA